MGLIFLVYLWANHKRMSIYFHSSLGSKRLKLRILNCDFESQNWSFKTVKITLLMVVARFLVYLSALHNLNEYIFSWFEVKTKGQIWGSELVMLNVKTVKRILVILPIMWALFLIYLSAIHKLNEYIFSRLWRQKKG